MFEAISGSGNRRDHFLNANDTGQGAAHRFLCGIRGAGELVPKRNEDCEGRWNCTCGFYLGDSPANNLTGSCGRRFILGEAQNRLLQLRINFICDGHHIE
jgi:hypothetical protein